MPLSYVYRGGVVRLLFSLVALALYSYCLFVGLCPFGNKFLIIQKKKISWNALSHKSFYSNLTSFRVNLVIGAANRKKSSMNLLQYPTNPKKLRISKTNFGLS